MVERQVFMSKYNLVILRVMLKQGPTPPAQEVPSEYEDARCLGYLPLEAYMIQTYFYLSILPLSGIVVSIVHYYLSISLC